jgi:hypothetical protein
MHTDNIYQRERIKEQVFRIYKGTSYPLPDRQQKGRG